VEILEGQVANKDELIEFIEREVLSKNESHPEADGIIKRKVRCTRMRLREQVSAEKVKQS
jgi:hypothetical protein